MIDIQTYATTMSDPSVSADYHLVAKAIAYLEERYSDQPGLDELADYLGLSPFHLQRLFKRWAGISPKRFLQFVTLGHAKELLAASHSVLDATFATGLSGPGRLHDLFVTVEAMTPGEFKLGGRGLVIVYGIHLSPFGSCLLAVTDRGVCGLSFLGAAGARAEIESLRSRWPNATLIEDPATTAPYLSQIFPADGASRSPGTSQQALRLLLAGTNFQLKVWEALLRIPSGTVCSYEDVAAAISQPTASRAVGGAVGANQIAFLIPCHRVIRKSGVIRDYRWGTIRKKAILAWEAAQQQGDSDAA